MYSLLTNTPIKEYADNLKLCTFNSVYKIVDIHALNVYNKIRKGGDEMLQYYMDSKEILDRIIKKGLTTSVIRREKIFSESTLQNLRKGVMVDSKTIGKICDILECQPDMIVKNVTSAEDEKKYRELTKNNF